MLFMNGFSKWSGFVRRFFFFFTVLFVPLLIVYFIVQLAMEAEIVAGE